MPEKRYKKGCGPSCIGCWRNRLKHGNPQSKAYLKKHPELLKAKHVYKVVYPETETETVPESGPVCVLVTDRVAAAS